MTSQTLCVVDANILIDLHHGEILPKLFALPDLAICAPDVLIAELTKGEPDGAALVDMGIEERSFSGEQVAEVERLRVVYQKPSLKDLFALLLARDTKALLLTGDANLRKAAQTESVACHGTLWVLDRMVATGVLATADAKDTLKRMLACGRRLPAGECTQRIARWS